MFSKLLSGMWPHFDAVAKRSQNLYGDFKAGHDIAKYTTTGTEDKRVEVKKAKRHDSPSKMQASVTGGSTMAVTGGNKKESTTDLKEVPVQQPATAPAKFSTSSGPDVLCGSHLKSPEDLTGFPTFPAGTKSLLMKHLSKDLW